MSSGGGRTDGLLGIRTFVIGPAVLHQTLPFLQEAGKDGCEGFVIWAGRLDAPDVFRFTTALIPEQQALVTESGLLVVVEGEALFKINKEVHERREIIAGQVHTHPTSAYHSSTDDHFPLVTLLGGLSVVIPDFAMNAPTDVDAWAWYRLADYGSWVPAPPTTRVVFE